MNYGLTVLVYPIHRSIWLGSFQVRLRVCLDCFVNFVSQMLAPQKPRASNTFFRCFHNFFRAQSLGYIYLAEKI